MLMAISCVMIHLLYTVPCVLIVSSSVCRHPHWPVVLQFKLIVARWLISPKDTTHPIFGGIGKRRKEECFQSPEIHDLQSL